ncbi:hypothetical protein ACLQ25_11920 [Micromonospora sp. DT44]|uniref:hypothetical protein n=1 Tax=Micromonospora sp. DT44 TaxID=3393439 RepID=UPI003CEE892A
MTGRRWSWRAVGRRLAEGMIAVGSYHLGLPAPGLTWRADDELERALWAQLPEVRRLLRSFGTAGSAPGDGRS